MRTLRVIQGKPERRKRRRGRRDVDAPEDTAGRLAVATAAFWLGVAVGWVLL